MVKKKVPHDSLFVSNNVNESFEITAAGNVPIIFQTYQRYNQIGTHWTKQSRIGTEKEIWKSSLGYFAKLDHILKIGKG